MVLKSSGLDSSFRSRRRIDRRSVGFWILALTLSFSGCTFWRNFSTYFNTIYLARKHLEAYEDQAKQTQVAANGAVAVLNHRWLDEEYDTRELARASGEPSPIQPTFSRALTGTKQVNNIHLDSAIILGSKVLANKKETKYIEDALFIVGKAQYDKNDFSGARRKFLELLYRFPDTKYGAEVQVLLSQSMLANHQLDTAKVALNTAMAEATKQGDKDVLGEVHRAYAEYLYALNPDTLSAIANELHQAEQGLSGDDLARLAYEEGAVYYFNSDWDHAEQAFRTAYSAANSDWLAGEDHIAHALALRRMQKFDEARKELSLIADKAKYGSSHPAAQYELAYTDELAARADVKNDLRSEQFRTELHPKLHMAYYTLDTTFRNTSAVIISRAKFRDAEMYREMGDYDSASRLAVSLIGTKDFSTQAMNDLVNSRMRSLSQFSRWTSELKTADSLETVIKTPPSHYTGPHDPQTEMHFKAMQEVLGARWRPEIPVTLSREDSLRVMQVESRLKLEHNAVHRTVISDTLRYVDSLHYLQANSHYQLGLAYESFNELPQARQEYRTALAYHFVFPASEKDSLRAQTLYAWMQLESRQRNKTVSDSLLHELLTYYGQTAFAEQARALFVNSGQTSPGELAYQAAYKTLSSQGLDAAKAPLLDVVTAYRHEDVAPRALFAIGESYEEQSRFDSAVVYYREVLKDYPYSIYANTLRPRLADAGAAGARVMNPGEKSPFQIQQEKEQEKRAEDQRKQAQSPPGLPGMQHGSTRQSVTPGREMVAPLGVPPQIPGGVQRKK